MPSQRRHTLGSERTEFTVSSFDTNRTGPGRLVYQGFASLGRRLDRALERPDSWFSVREEMVNVLHVENVARANEVAIRLSTREEERSPLKAVADILLKVIKIRKVGSFTFRGTLTRVLTNLCRNSERTRSLAKKSSMSSAAIRSNSCLP